MNKSEIKMLQKAFEAEIDGRFLQSKSKVAKKLCDDGFLKEYEVSYGQGWSKVYCSGYLLTVTGYAVACYSYDDGDEL